MLCRTVCLALVLGTTEAASFRKSAGEFLDNVRAQELESTLLEEIELSYGSVSQRGRFSSLGDFTCVLREEVFFFFDMQGNGATANF